MALEMFQDKAELKIQDPSVFSVTERNYGALTVRAPGAWTGIGSALPQSAQT